MNVAWRNQRFLELLEKHGTITYNPHKVNLMEMYLVCAMLKPTAKEAEEGAVPKVILEPTVVLAKNQEQARMKVMRLLPAEVEGKDDRVEIRAITFQGSGA